MDSNQQYLNYLKKQLKVSIILSAIFFVGSLNLYAYSFPDASEAKSLEQLMALLNLHTSTIQPFIVLIVAFTFNLVLRAFNLYDKIKEIEFKKPM
jgi:hypothetical protein